MSQKLLTELRSFPRQYTIVKRGKSCQEVRAIALNTQVEERFLEALRPDQLTLALAALAHLEQEEQAEHKQWELRLERARYEGKRAERQYQTVEPENRLVARSLEQQWEDGTYSVEGAAARLGVFPGTIHKWLRIGKLTGYQLAKGMPWKVYLTEEDLTRLHEWLRQARQLKKETQLG